MAVFSQIAKGVRARKRAVECSTLDGTAFVCDLGLLSASDEAACIARAGVKARESGGGADEKDISFQFAYDCELVALAALDPESPDGAPRVFFDGGVEQVRANLDRDRVLLLAETQRAFQESSSPRQRGMGPGEFIAHVMTLAEGEDGDPHPFVTWPRSTLESFMRTLARLCVSSQTLKSPSSSDDEPAATAS